MGNESDLQQKHCTPCEGGVSSLSDDEEARLHAHIPDWEIERNGTHRLKRSFRFDSCIPESGILCKATTHCLR
jgi:hypothetical protein